jgi:tetraprenyl-beta-curcumene synthase
MHQGTLQRPGFRRCPGGRSVPVSAAPGRGVIPGATTGLPAGAPTASSSAASNYYGLRQEQDDGGYLASLVATCQEVLAGLPDYEAIAPHLHELAGYYIDLQVYKHIRPEERLPVMQAWFAEHRDALPEMTWYEFAACSGSTLGIFALVAYACRGGCDASLARAVQQAHFPWVQGLHILLDYLIDQDEDHLGGDLNFCAYYPSQAQMAARLSHFYHEANTGVAALPYASFHRVINQGLLGIYGSDAKVRRQEPVARAVRRLIRSGGAAWVSYTGCRVYRRLSPSGLLGEP